MDDSITLYELNHRLALLITSSSTQNVWITAELSDVNVRGGNCYMELLQKDASGRDIVAKARANCWSNVFRNLRSKFYAATGQDFVSGIKVMLRVSATYHAVYGLSLNVTDVNPDFTMGDLLRRRREILERLKAEGILNCNRELTWPTMPQRIAIISAPQAAGYGDFINQLFNNPSSLRFNAKLFPAIMQGEKAPRSIIAALEAVAAEQDDWDCVVLIRGGGATSDLIAFEDYELAYNVACFPLPIIIGLGHERDITVLDYIANMRVKTPTAAAAWLIERGEAILSALRERASAIHRAATERVATEKERLAHYEGLLPVAPVHALDRAKSTLRNSLITLTRIDALRIAPERARIDNIERSLPPAINQLIARAGDRLDTASKLLDVLSPAATLARGYSITRVDGHSVTSADAVPPGTRIETILANGTLVSTTV